jgi:hypothetical protein
MKIFNTCPSGRRVQYPTHNIQVRESENLRLFYFFKPGFSLFLLPDIKYYLFNIKYQWCGSSAVVFRCDEGASEKQGPDEERYRDWS